MTRDTEENAPGPHARVTTGMRVLDADGRELGRVERVISSTRAGEPGAFTLAPGAATEEERLVPGDAIARVVGDEVSIVYSREDVALLPTWGADAPARKVAEPRMPFENEPWPEAQGPQEDRTQGPLAPHQAGVDTEDGEGPYARHGLNTEPPYSAPSGNWRDATPRGEERRRGRERSEE